MITAFTLSAALANAQTKSATTDSAKMNVSDTSIQTSKSPPAKGIKQNGKKLPAGTAIHGGELVPLHNGKHDYTPGSPVGTGGAGGTMNGSQQGSASENAVGNKSSDELLRKNDKPHKNKNGKSGSKKTRQ